MGEKKKKYSYIWRGKRWNGNFSNKVKKNYKISFCTTCMNRLYNLKETLPENIEFNKNYSNLEFVILDYNSQDGLKKWMKKNMMEHIESGRVVYYRTKEPKYFSMAHSRNVVFKVATGEIINNIDADNYTVSLKGETRRRYDYPKECLASYINSMANECEKNVVFAKGKQLVHGRIGFYRKEFINLLGGYDENLFGYGYDDIDLFTRARLLGFTLCSWGGRYYGRIKTGGKEKGQNMERSWKITQVENKDKSIKNTEGGILVANKGKEWGTAKLIKNFREVVEI